MTAQDIAIKVENEFSKVYIHFQEFQQNTNYRKYWTNALKQL